MTTQLSNSPSRSPIPRKLDDAMITALSLAIAKGNYPYTACHLVGISWNTYDRWQQLAKQDELDGKTEEESIYLRLYHALKKAEADAETTLVAHIIDWTKEKKDQYAGMMFLERRYPERWGKSDRTKIDINETKEIKITHVEMILDKAVDGEFKEVETVKQLTE